MSGVGRASGCCALDLELSTGVFVGVCGSAAWVELAPGYNVSERILLENLTALQLT